MAISSASRSPASTMVTGISCSPAPPRECARPPRHPPPLRPPPAALASDDLVSVRHAGNGPHHDGLDDSALLDGSGELIELPIVEPLARIARIWAQELDGRLARAARHLDVLGVRPAQ